MITPNEAQRLNACLRVCIDEKDITYDDRCPTAGSCSWHCAALRFELKHGACDRDFQYLCARNAKYNKGNLTFYGYAEACVFEDFACTDGIYSAFFIRINTEFQLMLEKI